MAITVSFEPTALRRYQPRWRRRRGRRWTRPDRPVPLEMMLAAIPSLPRAVLARLTESMIDRMDEIDGDTDADWDEPYEEHDGREEEWR